MSYRRTRAALASSQTCEGTIGQDGECWCPSGVQAEPDGTCLPVLSPVISTCYPPNVYYYDDKTGKCVPFLAPYLCIEGQVKDENGLCVTELQSGVGPLLTGMTEIPECGANATWLDGAGCVCAAGMAQAGEGSPDCALPLPGAAPPGPTQAVPAKQWLAPASPPASGGGSKRMSAAIGVGGAAMLVAAGVWLWMK